MTHDTGLGGEVLDDEAAWDAEPNPEIVHWQPVHDPDRPDGSARHLSTAGALGLIALGSAVGGALALGAVAIGALAIGALAVGRARIHRLEIDELVVGRIRFKDEPR
jgi:hypothetical protein